MLTSALHQAADGAKSIFSLAELGNSRSTTRLINVAVHLAKYSEKSITRSSEGSEVMKERSYRFIRNPNASADIPNLFGDLFSTTMATSSLLMLLLSDVVELESVNVHVLALYS